MIKVSEAKTKITRHDLANPFMHLTYEEQLKKANAKTYEHFIHINFNNGYGQIIHFNSLKEQIQFIVCFVICILKNL